MRNLILGFLFGIFFLLSPLYPSIDSLRTNVMLSAIPSQEKVFDLSINAEAYFYKYILFRSSIYRDRLSLIHHINTINYYR